MGDELGGTADGEQSSNEDVSGYCQSRAFTRGMDGCRRNRDRRMCEFERGCVWHGMMGGGGGYGGGGMCRCVRNMFGDMHIDPGCERLRGDRRACEWDHKCRC